MGRTAAGPRLALTLTAIAVMAGLGYAFWCLVLAVQGWVASSTWASQIIQ